MKIAILSRNPKLYSTRRLVEATKEQGHNIRVIDHIRCFKDMGTESPSIHFKDETLDHGANEFTHGGICTVSTTQLGLWQHH